MDNKFGAHELKPYFYFSVTEDNAVKQYEPKLGPSQRIIHAGDIVDDDGQF